MRLVIEVLRVVQHQIEPHIDGEVLSVEVVVPDAALRHHEEAKELVRQDHLHFLIESLVVVVWLIRLDLCFLVLFAPLEALGGQLVDTQRA